MIAVLIWFFFQQHQWGEGNVFVVLLPSLEE